MLKITIIIDQLIITIIVILLLAAVLVKKVVLSVGLVPGFQYAEHVLQNAVAQACVTTPWRNHVAGGAHENHRLQSDLRACHIHAHVFT